MGLLAGGLTCVDFAMAALPLHKHAAPHAHTTGPFEVLEQPAAPQPAQPAVPPYILLFIKLVKHCFLSYIINQF